MARPLVLPDGFDPPRRLESNWCRLRPLAAEHTERDFEAVMETQERLRASAPNGWPREGFTLEENTRDLIEHEREFEARESFAYTVLSLDEVDVLGCVYFNPPADPDADVDVHLWIREREYAGGYALRLHRIVDDWLAGSWPFARVRYLRPAYCFAPGECLCGAVRYHAGPLRGPLELCHCPRCRRASGSAFAATVGVGEVRFDAGADRVRRFEHEIEDHPPGYGRCFCDRCGSPVPDPERAGAQEIPAGSLTLLPFTADRHSYVDHEAPWAPSTATPRFEAAEIRARRS
jgi:hypothetical protein